MASARPVPEFGPGDTVELRLSVPENKRRTTTFKVGQWSEAMGGRRRPLALPALCFCRVSP